MAYHRFAIYYVPSDDALAQFGARWLGWDLRSGTACAHYDLPGLEAATQRPRTYGFHATLKPPFALAEGRSPSELTQTVADLAAQTAPAQTQALELAALGRFLALVPAQPAPALSRLAAACVRDLDAFRAPPTADELARRRKARLSPRQESHLAQWGYPHVFEDFKFHMTLTGKLPKAEVAQWQDAILAHLPPLPQPFVVDQIALCGQRADGMFEAIDRFDLTG